ncbi:hypothetical protein ACFC34_00615 [Streptomyces sp. NPDC056053]|uniref:hypothetical protein n=1 Tax=Streptomyces sp. NPDC056053 TaxID=3345696 RepID=UPI0035E207DD
MDQVTQNDPENGHNFDNAPEEAADAPPLPWERQPDERIADYSRFRMYLALRNRSAASTGEALGLSTEYSRDLIKRLGWKERAAEYDRDEAEQLAADTRRERSQAISAVLRHIVDATEGLQVEEGERTDPRYLLALSSVVKNLTPGSDALLVSSTALGEDLISLAFQSAYKARGEAADAPDAVEVN